MSSGRRASAEARASTDPDTRTDLPTIDIRAERLDGADHLVPRHARIRESRHVACHDHRVAVTHAAGVHANSNLVTGGLRQRALLRAESTARLWDDHRAHGWHGTLLKLSDG
jgi:hypothetical protein